MLDVETIWKKKSQQTPEVKVISEPDLPLSHNNYSCVLFYCTAMVTEHPLLTEQSIHRTISKVNP